MSTLNVESLAKVVQTGDTERLFGAGGGGSSIAPESRVSREMVQQGLQPGQANEGVSFSDILRNSVDQVNTYQHQADTAINELVAGRNKNIHETMLSIEQADTSLKLMMQVRNKILDAYREIMRMQV